MNRLLLKRLFYIFLALLFVPSLFASESYAQTSPVDIDVIQPKTIEINYSFSGGKVSVREVIPSGNKVALRLIGPKEDLVLMRKDRVKGLWMNVEQIHFHDIPNVYLLMTSKDLSSVENRDSIKAMKLDYFSLLAESLPDKSLNKDPEKHQTDNSLLINELIKLKESDKLYQISDGTVNIKPLEKGAWDQVDAVLNVPAKISPGTYTLELFALKDGKSRLVRSSSIEVKLTGLPAMISNLAFKNGLLYGILAVIIATFSGLLIGVVFGSKGSH
ncbi:MAG: TIGR02186 family protein [Proteobacteria bacterium]|nr:TIGR02186 family protein [Pseudomonadota bacterium]